jgi:hypothetical protein
MARMDLLDNLGNILVLVVSLWLTDQVMFSLMANRFPAGIWEGCLRQLNAVCQAAGESEEPTTTLVSVTRLNSHVGVLLKGLVCGMNLGISHAGGLRTRLAAWGCLKAADSSASGVSLAGSQPAS